MHSDLPPHEAHARASPKDIRFALVTVSTSRFAAAASGTKVRDESGDVAEEAIRNAGYDVVARELVPDDRDAILSTVLTLLGRDDVDVVVTIGGTGPSLRDVTVETLRGLFDKELEGFGQLFRMLSYKEVGAAAVLSNATAGLRGSKAVFCIPGSPAAVRLALERIILPVVGHLLAVRRGLDKGVSLGSSVQTPA